jgi:hypothetical protein
MRNLVGYLVAEFLRPQVIVASLMRQMRGPARGVELHGIIRRHPFLGERAP